MPLFGNKTYTPEEIGTLTGIIDFEDIAPYAGIGSQGTMGKKEHWGIMFDIGVLFIGSPEVTLQASDGFLVDDKVFLSDLKKEEEDIEDDIEAFGFYPVISLGITYRF